MLGCGLLRREVLQQAGRHDVGWAAGLGLERFAMRMFKIPDIRLFWSKDERFLSQFKAGQINEYKPYSKYPGCYKDISFYLPTKFMENDLH